MITWPEKNKSDPFFADSPLFIQWTKLSQWLIQSVVNNHCNDFTIWHLAGCLLNKNTPFFPVPEFRNNVGEKEVVAIAEGADAKLPCPVKADPRYRLNVHWKKGNVTLQPAEHIRMRIKPNKYLKIKRTQKEDAGYYTCIAENSCGGKNTRDVQLFVESK